MRALRRHAEWICVPFFYLAVAFAFNRELWFDLGGRPRAIGWDNAESFWPDLVHLANSLRAGDWPLWNPFDRMGYPFHADPHVGLHYPLNWIMAGIGAITGTVPLWVAELKVMAHEAIAGALLHAYARSRRLPVAAAVLAGVAFIVSGPITGLRANATFWNVAWTPLVWIATDRLIAGAGEAGWWRRSAALAGALFLAGASGPPPGFFQVLVAGAAYGAFRIAQALFDARRERRLARAALAQARAVMAAAAITVALLAIVVAPGFDILADSKRADRTVEYAAGGGLDPELALRSLFVPGLARAHSYLGIAVVAFAAAALALRPRRDRWAPVFFAVLALFTFVLASGKHTPVLRFLVEHVPGFGLFRAPSRYTVLLAMLIAIPAAHGVAALIDDAVSRRRRWIGLGAAAAAILGATAIAFAAGGRPIAHVPGGIASILAALIAIALCAALAISKGRWRVVALAAVPLAGYVDGEIFVRPLLHHGGQPVVDHLEDRRWIEGLGDVAREWRVYDEYVMEQRAGSRLGVRELRAYPSSDPLADLRYRKLLQRAARDPRVLEAFNVRWILHGSHHRNGFGKHHVKRPPSELAPAHFRRIDAKRYEALHPVPLVAWYGRVAVVADGDPALDAVLAAEDAEGRRATAVVEKSDVPRELRHAIQRLAAPADASHAPVRLIQYGAQRIAFEVDTPAEGLVVLNEAMFPGWRVTVDGEPAIALRANYLLRAVHVAAPGRHVIEWSYRPRGHGWLRALWAIGVGLLLAAALSAYRSRRT